jgi:hypothetical protein
MVADPWPPDAGADPAPPAPTAAGEAGQPLVGASGCGVVESAV